ncbi:MAG: IS110 family transposase [Actinobacteria bacterium]|nr:IS110 family transposase [Actinomycetota bacterium]
MPQITPFVGLDVHASQTHAGVLDQETGELYRRRLKGEPSSVVPAFLEQLGRGARAVYEAGPTGFGLARAATERGLDVRVCAPGLIPQKPADHVKTDARDAERLARLLAAGELAFVRVPSVEEEQLRDLVRAREDLRRDLTRARQRLSHFLRRRELRFGGPGKAWTQRHRRWLSGLAFEDRASQLTFADYLAGVEGLLQRRSSLEAALAELAPQSPWAQTIARLRCFRGIDTLSAVGLCAEVGDFARFSRPAQLAGFLGLVPSERTSDQRRRQGRITKAGPEHARWLVVEAAQHAWRSPRVSEELRRRQAGQDPRACEVAWRAQRRLHDRWQKLVVQRGKPANVATVACARELCAFVWEAALIR